MFFLLIASACFKWNDIYLNQSLSNDTSSSNLINIDEICVFFSKQQNHILLSILNQFSILNFNFSQGSCNGTQEIQQESIRNTLHEIINEIETEAIKEENKENQQSNGQPDFQVWFDFVNFNFCWLFDYFFRAQEHSMESPLKMEPMG